MADDRAYRIILVFDPEKSQYLARVPELEVEAWGASRGEAIGAAEQAIETRFEQAAHDGVTLASPVDAAEPEGPLSLTFAPALHRELLFHAQRARMSPEALAAQLVAAGLGRLDQGPRSEARVEEKSHRPRPEAREDNNRDRRGPPQGQGRRSREGYRPDMEDQANFLAYVRDMEKGGGGRRR